MGVRPGSTARSTSSIRSDTTSGMLCGEGEWTVRSGRHWVVEHHFPGGCVGINGFGQRHETDSTVIEVRDDLDKMPHRMGHRAEAQAYKGIASPTEL